MKSIVVCAALVFVCSIGGLAAPTTPGDLSATRAALRSAQSRSDSKAYRAFLDDQLTWIDPSGRVRNVADVMSSLPKMKAAADEIGVDLRTYPGGALVSGLARDNAGGEVVFVEIWTVNSGRWRLSAYQGTFTAASKRPPASPIPDAAPLSESSGSPKDLEAVASAIAATMRATNAGDVETLGGLLTDGFISVDASGRVTRKVDRLQGLKGALERRGARPPDLPATPPAAASTRILGELAITLEHNVVENAASGRDTWRTMLSVNEDGTWKRAAAIVTRAVSAPTR